MDWPWVSDDEENGKGEQDPMESEEVEDVVDEQRVLALAAMLDRDLETMEASYRDGPSVLVSAEPMKTENKK